MAVIFHLGRIICITDFMPISKLVSAMKYF